MTNYGGNSARMKFTKSETEYNMKSIRFLLLTITTMFIVIAGLMITLGISVYSHYHTFAYFYEDGNGKVLTPSILSVILGMILLIVTLFGFFGALRQSTCMVNLYALFLALSFLVKLVIVILAFSVDGDSVTKYINVPVWNYAHDPEIQDEVDRLQNALSCCGSNSYLDYVGVEFSSNHSTVYYSSLVEGSHLAMTLPTTCCASGLGESCTRVKGIGCKAAIVNVLLQNSGVIGVLGVSVMFIEVLGITFSLLLARCIRKVKSERALIEWKIKEQMIMAQQEIKKNNAELALHIGHNASSNA